MTIKQLEKTLKEVDRTNDFRDRILGKDQLISETEKVFMLARIQMGHSGALNQNSTRIMEEAIEALYRCREFKEAMRYTNKYRKLRTISYILQYMYAPNTIQN